MRCTHRPDWLLAVQIKFHFQIQTLQSLPQDTKTNFNDYDFFLNNSKLKQKNHVFVFEVDVVEEVTKEVGMTQF